jgi:mycofactocin system glycosyltransferase
MAMTRYVVDATWRRDGATLFAGSPLMRFTFSGTALLDRLETGGDFGGPDDVATNDLVDRLLEAGAIHPLPGAHPFHVREVTVVIPAHVVTPSDVDALETLICSIPEDATVIIVDDASPQPIAESSRARIVRHAVQRGPAAARNSGLCEVTTPFVAFLDIDVEPPANLLDELLPFFVDDRVGLVAPRIESRPGTSVLARYEQVRSPLDLGPTEGRVRAGTRVGYVPSATWLCRTDAIRAIDGFDESMTTGEDVDAVWRLDQAGWRCRYQPDISCLHEPRQTWAALFAQRTGYGRSAAALAEKHGNLVAPARTTPSIAAAWSVGAFFSPMLGVLIAGVDAARLARKLRPSPTADVVRLTARTHRHAGGMFAAALTRTWWPIALLIALVSRRARRVLVLAAVLPAAFEWRRRRAPIDPARFLFIRVLDDAAYGFGVWQGARRKQSATALLPTITPPRAGDSRYRDVP